MLPTHSKALLAISAASLLVACNGLIGDPAPGGGLDTNPQAVCTDRSVMGTAEGGVRRLSSIELRNSLKALIGDDVWNAIPAAVSTLPIDGDARELFAPGPNAGQVDAMVEVASQAASVIAGDTTIRTRVVGACASSEHPADTCIRAFVQSFGKRAYRRPLTNDEVTTYVQGYNAAEADIALQVVIARLLIAPQTQFVIENGKEVDGKRVRLTDFEIASRIAFAVTQQAPDDALLQAAERGELGTLDQVQTQVRRLMSTPAARETMRELASYWFNFAHIQPSTRTAIRRGWTSEGLSQEVQEEALDFVEHVFFEGDGGVAELLSTNLVFPKGERIAEIYGTSASADGVVPPKARRGILTRAALLVNTLDFTSPIHRGAGLLRRALCQDIPSPDPEDVAARQTEVETFTRLDHSTRDVTTNLTSPAFCQTCHVNINAVGFLFEGYDELGALRDKELVFDESNTIVVEHPIDTAVSNVSLGGVDSGPLANADDLIDYLLEQQPLVAECFAKQALRFVRYRKDARSDACAIQDAAKAMGEGGSLVDGFVALAGGEQIFWRAAP